MFYRAFSVIALSYPFVDLFKIGLQSGCRYTKRETLGFYNDVAEYWEAHPHTTPRLYWKESFVKASGINRDLLPVIVSRQITICLTKIITIMQFTNKDFNPAQHDRWRALTVKNPYATAIGYGGL